MTTKNNHIHGVKTLMEFWRNIYFHHCEGAKRLKQSLKSNKIKDLGLLRSLRSLAKMRRKAFRNSPIMMRFLVSHGAALRTGLFRSLHSLGKSTREAFRPMPLIIIVVICIMACFWTSKKIPCNLFLSGVTHIEPIMGTFLQIKVSSHIYPQKKAKKIVDKAFLLARCLDKKLSIFWPESEINMLNIQKNANASPELFQVITAAENTGRLTGGAFDITVAPVLKKAGFYHDMPDDVLNKIPDDISGMGWKNITLADDTRRITLEKNTWIDLSGIAKGYIVDKIAEYLKQNGIFSFLIDAGGDIYCGDKDKNSKWIVGIRCPGSESIICSLALKSLAVVTSGDYENVIVEDSTNRKISHIVDPSFLEVKEEKLFSVTVIAPTCTEADALATGMMAMGEEKALKLANTISGVYIICVQYAPCGYKVKMSKGAESFLLRRFIP